jgi:hypothetical protein
MRLPSKQDYVGSNPPRCSTFLQLDKHTMVCPIVEQFYKPSTSDCINLLVIVNEFRTHADLYELKKYILFKEPVD